MKRCLSILLSVLLLLSAGFTNRSLSRSADEEPSSGTPVRYIEAAESFDGGSGTEEDPYRIATAEQLALLSAYCSEEGMSGLEYAEYSGYQNSWYILTADIELNDTSDIGNWGENAPEWSWRPIGEYSAFRGRFDGDGHTVSGMYIHSELVVDGSNNRDGGSYPGLFGQLSGAVVEDLRLGDSYIVVDGVASSVGGIASQAYDSDILRCESGVVIETGKSNYIGGIVGWTQSGGELEECVFAGRILAADNCTVGGIAGYASEFEAIADCRNSGVIELTGEDVSLARIGGIAASVSPGQDSVIQGCVNEADISSGSAPLGGIVGTAGIGRIVSIHPGEETEYAEGNLTIRDCVNSGNLASRASGYPVGGIVQLIFGTSDRLTEEENGDMTVTVSGCVNEGGITSASSAGGIVGECVSANHWVLENCTNAGSVYAVSGAAGIVAETQVSVLESAIRGCVNEGEVYSETTGAGGILYWHSGFSLYVEEDEAAPLTVENCVNRGPVTCASGTSGLGGIVGSTNLNTAALYIRSCRNEGEIHAEEGTRMGGILGSSYFGDKADGAYEGPTFTASDCVNTGALTQGDGSFLFSADLVSRGEMPESYAADTAALLVMAVPAVGGIAGYCLKGVVENCVNAGEIRLDAGSRPLLAAEEIFAMAALEEDGEAAEQTGDETRSFACGGICGAYFYLESDGSTPDNTGLRDCVYPHTMPMGAYCLLETTGIENVAALPLEEVQAAADALAG